MTWRDLVLRLRALLFRRRADQELDEELQFHLEMQARKLGSTEGDAAEAKRRARVQFGGLTRAMEECREARGLQFFDTLARDARHAMHALRKNPSFTWAAVGTLAVAIGANAVAFSALNGLVLRPPSVPQARSLYAPQPRLGDTSLQVSYPDYVDLRDRNRSFDGLAAFSVAQAGIDSGGDASTIWDYEVSTNYFDVLRIRPYLGRFFHAADEHGPNSAPYVVLSYAYWQAHFLGDRGVVGRTVQLNKHPFVVRGVAPPGFHGTLLFFSPALYVPMVNEQQIDGGPDLLHDRSKPRVFMTVGHLKPGVTPPQAVADLDAIGAYLQRAYPKDDAPFSFSLKRPGLYGDFAGRPTRAFLTALLLLTGLILLAACANLGSLFAARAADHSREIALRMALGATRRRVLRLLFTEALLVSLFGGAAGIWGSVFLLHGLSVWRPLPQLPINLPVSPDGHVYLFALLLALVSAFLFGAAPVRQVMGADPYQVIKVGTTGLPTRRFGARDLMLGAQIAICAILITASFVAVRGLARSLQGHFGVEPRHVTLVETDLGMAGYRGAAVPAMQKRMIAAVETIPGVSAVGMADWAPLGGEGWKDENVYTARTADLRPAQAAADATEFKISPGYLRAADTPLLAGRTLTWADDEGAPRVAIINREFARRLFGSAVGALGEEFKLHDGTRVRVVGVVADGKYNSLTENRQPAMFLPLLQSPASDSCLVVRSGDDPAALAAAVRGKLRELDPGLPAVLQTWTSAMKGVLFPSRVAAVALGVLGIMGAILSVVGIFGMAANAVGKRKRELGIRLALGAQTREVLQAALGRAVKLLAAGSALGLLLGILASRVLSAIVYEATPRDPLVLAGVVLAMGLIGLLATWVPAQRARSLDPAMLLRQD